MKKVYVVPSVAQKKTLHANLLAGSCYTGITPIYHEPTPMPSCPASNYNHGGIFDLINDFFKWLFG